MIPINRYIMGIKSGSDPKELLIGKYVISEKGIFQIVKVEGEFTTKDNINYRLRTDLPYNLYATKIGDENKGVWEINGYSKNIIYVLNKAGELLYG